MKDYFCKFIGSFHRSEVIWWARIQAMFVPVLIGLHNIDWSPYINDRTLLVCYIAGNSVLTEMLRRHREDWSRYDEPPQDEPK